METIHMSDIYGQYLTMKEEIDQAIQEVIHSAQFIKGEKVNNFEAKLATYLNTNVVSCGNGTDALQIAFMALDLEPGDEVITTPFTFVATVEAAVFMGLKPLFVDVCPDTYNMDISQIEQLITPRTKVILPVHLFGHCANMDEIIKFAQRYNLKILEDACQALGTEFIFPGGVKQKAGTIGHIGCTSFFPSKNLGAFGDAGAIFTKSEEQASIIRSIANHGMVTKYHYQRIGVNSRLDSIQAAILEVKLRYIEKHISARQKVALYYDEHLRNLEEISLPERKKYSTHTFHQYTIRANKRDELKKFLESKEIPSMIYYPVPLHLQEAYQFLGYNLGDFPVCEKLSQTVLSLPMHSELKEGQLKYIVEQIKQYYIKNK